MGNALERLSAAVDFEAFRPVLEEALRKPARKSPAGRRPIDPVLMFKVLVLQRTYGLSDEQAEYQLTDRASFRAFVGVGTCDDVPDARTVWAFREALTRAGALDALFAAFRARLDAMGLSCREGKIVDATFVEAPRQRDSRDENRRIKEGGGGGLWAGEPAKRAHKDVDARWTVKGGVAHYGYKDHVKVDAATKLIEAHTVTAANVHDSKEVAGLIGPSDALQPLFLDAGYDGREREVKERGMFPVVCRRARRGAPLTASDRAVNSVVSRRRSRVEHVFGFIEGSMGGSVFRGVGLARAKAACALTCLTYNLHRFARLLMTWPGLSPVTA